MTHRLFLITAIVFGLTQPVFAQIPIDKETEYLGIQDEVEYPSIGPFEGIDIKKCNEAVYILKGSNSTEKEEKIKDIMENAQQYCPNVFYLLSRILFEQGKKDEAVFWFLAGNLRGRYDANRSTDEWAGRAIDEFNDKYGPHIFNYIIPTPKKFEEILLRVVQWDIDTPHTYDHRWIDLRGKNSLLYAMLYDNEDKFTEIEPVLSKPESEWKKIKQQTHDEYLSGFYEGFKMLRESKK